MEINEFKDFLSILPQPHYSSKPKKHQAKLSEAKVLLINLNTTMTELAKSLIYKGIHIYLYDRDFNGNKNKITKEDATNNYYLQNEDIKKERIQVLYQRLLPLNISVSITILEDLNNIRGLTIACLGFSTFTILSHYEDYFTRKNIPFYCINHSGIFGFFYNNLKDTRDNKRIKNKRNSRVKNRLSPQNSLISLIEKLGLTSKRSEYSGSKISSPQPYMRNNNIDLGIKENNHNTMKINPLVFNKKAEIFMNQIKFNDKTDNNLNSKIKDDQYLNFIIYLIETYYRKNVNSIHTESSSEKFQKKTIYINNFLHLNGLNCFIENEKFQITLKKFLLNFNKELSPICSTLGELVAKEIFKYITGELIPKTGLIALDFEIEAFDYLSFLSV